MTRVRLQIDKICVAASMSISSEVSPIPMTVCHTRKKVSKHLSHLPLFLSIIQSTYQFTCINLSVLKISQEYPTPMVTLCSRTRS